MEVEDTSASKSEVDKTSASKSEVDKPPSTPDMSAHDAEALLQNKGLVTPTCVTVDKEKCCWV